VAIGNGAATNTQATGSIAIGHSAGTTALLTGFNSIAIGTLSSAIDYATCVGSSGSAQSLGVAIGAVAHAGTGGVVLGAQSTGLYYAIAIGAHTVAGTGSIVINAGPTGLQSSTGANSLYIRPIRLDTGGTTDGFTGALTYNTTTFEVAYNTAKTFVIPHPHDRERHLVHACLEGPEAGVYYRGKTRVKPGSKYALVDLPSYACSIASDWNIQITPIGTASPSRIPTVSLIENNQFTIFAEPGEYFWVAYGCRQSIETEPLKAQAHVLGQGPYRYIGSPY
jgi:hypothetical protein